MTEYDYSPEAWEHHVAQQARVSNWVSQTTAQAHCYSNPFVMSPTMRDRSFYDEPGGRRQRPSPSRSKTFNVPPARQEEPYRHTSSRSRSGSYSQPVEWLNTQATITLANCTSHLSAICGPYTPSPTQPALSISAEAIAARATTHISGILLSGAVPRNSPTDDVPLAFAPRAVAPYAQRSFAVSVWATSSEAATSVQALARVHVTWFKQWKGRTGEAP
ncbi:hypothetical protein F4604DRAFT_640516 [Suillus subluteus]|nr:hypothetical protein F4604DRAFT_640516 [Suillus subluteus]